MAVSKNLVTFIKLKKLLIISSFLLLTACAGAQVRTSYISQNPPVVKYYPNPASVAINFEFAGTETRGMTMQLFNFMGKKVYEFVPANSRFFVMLDGFTRGVYIYQLRDKTGKIVDSGKFQVVR